MQAEHAILLPAENALDGLRLRAARCAGSAAHWLPPTGALAVAAVAAFACAISSQATRPRRFSDCGALSCDCQPLYAD